MRPTINKNNNLVFMVSTMHRTKGKTIF